MLIHRILFTTEAQRAQKINWVSAIKETQFIVRAKPDIGYRLKATGFWPSGFAPTVGWVRVS